MDFFASTRAAGSVAVRPLVDMGFVSLLASIVLVVISVLLYVRGELQLGVRLLYREERVRVDPVQLLSQLENVLRARGYTVERRNHELVVRTGLANIPVRPITVAGGGYAISWWMEPTTASIIIFVAGLALYLVPALLVAFLAYMRYDEVSGIIRANIT